MTLIASRSPLRRLGRLSVGLLAIGSVLLQTVAVSYGQAIVASPGGPDVTQAPNGVPLVNIAAPNANGLSHNIYDQFDVGTPGAILNNSTVMGQSVLGGLVMGNANLGGRPASIILNEVTSTDRSTLNGMIEVFGGSAAVVVANPNGISCDGCGFINTPRATLTTGKPVISGGQLTGLSVDAGVIDIGAGGLDARTTDYFDVISRAAILNGAIHGEDVGIYAGRNDFDYVNRTVTAVKADDGSVKPAVAIDSSALGGMYANRITLESTEAGVGVKAPTGLIAGTGGMSLTADGKLVIGSATSKGAIRAQSNSSDVAVSGIVHADGGLSVMAGADIDLDNGVLSAFGDISLAGRGITLSNTALIAGVDEQGTIQSGVGTVQIDAVDVLSTDADSIIRGGDDVSLSAGNIALAGQTVSDAQIDLVAATTLTTSSGQVLLGLGGVSAAAGGDMALEGTVQSGGDIVLAAGGDVFLGGTAVARRDFNAYSAGTITLVGKFRAGRDLSLSGGSIVVADNAQATAGRDAAFLALAGLSVGSGAVVAAGVDASGDLGTEGALLLSANVITIGNARLAAAEEVDLVAASTMTLTGSTLSAGGDLTLSGQGLTSNATITSGTAIGFDGTDIVNSGALSAQDAITLASTGDINNSGTVLSNGTITFSATDDIDQSGAVESGTDLTVEAGGLLHNTADARLVSGGDLKITAGALTNNGAIGAGRDLSVAVTGDIANSDLLSAKRNAVLALDGTFTNTGTVYVANDLDIVGLNGPRASAIINRDAIIEANAGTLTILAGQVRNQTTGISVVTDYATNTASSYVQGECIDNWGAFGDDTVCAGTHTATTTQVWTDRAQGTLNRARLLAGSDMLIAANLIKNEYGLMAANGDMALSGTTLTNTGQDLIRKTTVTVNVQRDELYCSVDFFGCGRHDVSAVALAPSVNNSSATTGSIFATIQAGGSLTGTFTNAINNVSIRQNASQIGLSSGGGVSGPLPQAVNFGFAVSGLPDGGSASGPRIDLGALLDGGSLTQVVPDPKSAYLIESRPEFVDVSHFFNSDYFFSRMPDYQPEIVMRRLGDAYVETRLIQDQIAALTGRRLLEDFGSDLEQIQALYDNALDEAEALNLKTGVALTAEQVGGLTHDIIWQERMVVDGQEVLVPHVYLADVTRTGNGGGQLLGDEIILASTELTNSGAIEADGATRIDVAGDLTNLGGLIGGDIVDLDVGNTLANLSGTIAAGVVTIDAQDLINQTIVTRDGHAAGFSDRLQQAATIAGTGDVDLNIGNSVTLIGGTVSAGDDLTIDAGGQVAVVAAEVQSSSGITFAEGHDQRDSLANDLAQLSAGGDLSVSAGEDLSLIGANVSAGGDATLSAEGDVVIAAVQDTDQVDRAVSITGEGIFGTGLLGTQTDITEASANATSAGGAVVAGGDIAVTSQTVDITLDGAQVEAGGGIALSAEEGQVALLTQTDSAFSQDTRAEESLLWWSKNDTGQYAETVVQTLLDSQYGVAITTRDGIKVEYHDTGDINQSIDQLSQVDGLGWMADLRDRDDVQWNAVIAAQSQWHHQEQGLTTVGAALVALAVSTVTAGMGTSIATGMGFAQGSMAAAAMEAGFTSLASQASIALINNQGDIAAALEDLGSSDTIRSLIGAMLTAGLTQGALDVAGIGPVSPQLSFTDNLANAAQSNLIKAAIRAGVGSVVEGQPLDDALLGALRLAAADSIGAAVATEIGNFGLNQNLNSGDITKIALHAIAGCAVGAIGSDNCLSGAIAEGLQEVLGAPLSQAVGDPARENQIITLIGGVVGALAGGSAEAVNAGAQAAATGHAFNFLSHEQNQEQLAELGQCAGDQACINRVDAKYDTLNVAQENKLMACRTLECVAEYEARIKDAFAYSAEDIEALSAFKTSGAADRLWAWTQLNAQNPTLGNLALATVGASNCAANPGSNCFMEGIWADFANEAVTAAVYAVLGGIGTPTKVNGQTSTPPNATAPIEKFSDYIFKEGASHGKDAIFRGLGYGKEDSARLATMWQEQAAAKFSQGQYTVGKLDQYGQRISITIDVPGVGNAIGKSSSVTSGWMIRPDGGITLNTPFSGFPK